MGEVEIGGKYELIVTNRSGLYRYRLGDVVRVVGRHKKAPVVKFCYRRNQVINVAGEKSNRQQLDTAVKRFAGLTRTEVVEYCVREDFSGIAPGYLFYMECRNAPRNVAGIFERCMCEANPEYRACRNTRKSSRCASSISVKAALSATRGCLPKAAGRWRRAKYRIF